MLKKLLAVLLAVMMLAACGGGSETKTSTATSTATSVAENATEDAKAALDALGLTAEFEPNTDYDEYTLVDYTIEAVDAEFVATVSRKSDKSAYEIHCNFYGDEQLVVVENGEVTSDLTGFLSGDAPAIIEAAEKQNIWVPTK